MVVAVEKKMGGDDMDIDELSSQKRSRTVGGGEVKQQEATNNDAGMSE